LRKERGKILSSFLFRLIVLVRLKYCDVLPGVFFIEVAAPLSPTIQPAAQIGDALEAFGLEEIVADAVIRGGYYRGLLPQSTHIVPMVFGRDFEIFFRELCDLCG
jgi:hypothetical protein